MEHKDSNSIGPEKIIEKKREFLLPCSYNFYTKPPQIVKGKGTKLTDHNGKEYIDFFAGVSVMSCGHCNEKINKRVIDQINTLQHTTSIYLTQPVVDLAEELSKILPGNIEKSFFCNSGSEANEGAMLLARVYTEKKEFISLGGGLHGRTYLTSGATGIEMWRTDPFCDDLPIHIANSYDEVITLIKERGDKIAALILEPIQGNGGIRPLPLDYFEKIKPLLEKENILLISDEIQTGFARTGKMFAIEHYNIVPDILTGAKALGNGFPIGFFATNSKIAKTFTRPSASTLGGNPVSCQAGLGVLEFIKEENLLDKANILGDRLYNGLTKINRDVSFTEKPRGLGLMIGLPILDYKSKKSSELTDYILERMMEEGFLIGKNGLGRNVLAFQPPLIITETEISNMLKKLKQIFMEIK